MAVALTIAGIDETSLLVKSDAARQPLTVDNEIKARTVASFELISLTGSYRPLVGQVVTITDPNGTTIFAGTIEQIFESLFRPAGPETRYMVHCVDYTQILDRRVHVASYTNQTCSQIITDMVNTQGVGKAYLAAEGITLGGVDTGPTIAKATFKYEKCSAILDHLSELSGYNWWMDFNKQLNFKTRDKVAAPYSLTDTSANFRNMEVETTREDYRNRQWIQAGVDTLSMTGGIPSPPTGGAVTLFFLPYPVAAQPTIKLDGIAVASTDIGYRSVDTGRLWYWQKNDNSINAVTAPGSSQALTVDYTGYYPIMVSDENAVEQVTRAALEGGTGIYENVRVVDVDDLNWATALANGLLNRYGAMPQKLHWETDTPGLFPGQLISVTITKHNLSGNYLITRVKAYDAGLHNQLRYDVLAVSGEAY